VEPGKSAWKLIIGHFGVDVLLQDGHIDRPKLGRIVFEDAGKRHLLNICTHPYIQRAMLWEAVKFFLKGWRLTLFIPAGHRVKRCDYPWNGCETRSKLTLYLQMEFRDIL